MKDYLFFSFSDPFPSLEKNLNVFSLNAKYKMSVKAQLLVTREKTQVFMGIRTSTALYELKRALLVCLH